MQSKHPKGTKRFQRIRGGSLLSTDDFQLCMRFFDVLVARYGKGDGNFSVMKCKPAEQVVLLVWHATGIIDNGGFEFLFEDRFKGDPALRRTLAGFRTIGAKKCASALRSALAVFPDATPFSSLSARAKHYLSVPEAKRRAWNDRFFSESRSISTMLARFIRANESELQR